MHPQLPLRIGFTHRATLANFIADGNEELVATLKAWLAKSGNELLFLWGASGSGRTHLLSAACDEAESAGRSWSYLPLGEGAPLEPRVLEGLEQRELICLDDIDAVAGDPRWEEALFHLYNRTRGLGHQLIVAANAGPIQLPIALADLRSRLSAGLCYHVRPLDDGSKLALLQYQAEERGLELSAEAATYLLSRCPRDTGALTRLMDKLDSASLVEKRRLTIPFLRSILEADGQDGSSENAAGGAG